jgi:hypothetical protein
MESESRFSGGELLPRRAQKPIRADPPSRPPSIETPGARCYTFDDVLLALAQCPSALACASS